MQFIRTNDVMIDLERVCYILKRDYSDGVNNYDYQIRFAMSDKQPPLTISFYDNAAYRDDEFENISELISQLQNGMLD